jgi:hypothetical protein
LKLFLLEFFSLEASLDSLDVSKVSSEFLLGIKRSDSLLSGSVLFFGSLWYRFFADYSFDSRDLLLLFL